MSSAAGWLAAVGLADTGIDAWTRPAWLWLGVAATALVCLLAARRRSPGLAWVPWQEALAARARRFDGVRGVTLLLRGAALAALAAVLAGPTGVHRAPPEPGEGLDLVLALDASGSMRALDTQVASEWRTRLDLAREVVARFARRRAAEGDRVGLVVFGRSAFTQSPLTSDGRLLAAALERVEPGMAGEATALGDALALAVKRVVAAGPEAAEGRVVVLLSDGRHNAGARSPDEAARLAAASGVRVHTVAVGTAGENVAMAPAADAPLGGLHFERHDVDYETLARVARATGGRFYPARRSTDLEAVYAEIDALERVVRSRPPRLRHTARPEPLLAAAGLLLIAEIALARVWRRRAP